MNLSGFLLIRGEKGQSRPSISLIKQFRHEFHCYKLNEPLDGQQGEWHVVPEEMIDLIIRDGGNSDRELRVLYAVPFARYDVNSASDSILKIEDWTSYITRDDFNLKSGCIIPIIGKDVIGHKELLKNIKSGNWSLRLGWPHLIYRSHFESAQKHILNQKRLKDFWNNKIDNGMFLLDGITYLAVPAAILKVGGIFSQRSKSAVDAQTFHKSVRAILDHFGKEQLSIWRIMENMDSDTSRGLLQKGVTKAVRLIKTRLFNIEKRYREFSRQCDDVNIDIITAASLATAVVGINQGVAEERTAFQDEIDRKMTDVVDLAIASDLGA